METCLGLLFLDLDRFKKVNDTYGHETGDRLLKLVAQRFQTCYRRVDSICRFAGDEFIILLENIDGESAIHLVESKQTLHPCTTYHQDALFDGESRWQTVDQI